METVPEPILSMKFVWKDNPGHQIEIKVFKPIQTVEKPRHMTWICYGDILGLDDYVHKERMWGESSLQALALLLRILRIYFEPHEGRKYCLAGTDEVKPFDGDFIFGTAKPRTAQNGEPT